MGKKYTNDGFFQEPKTKKWYVNKSKTIDGKPRHISLRWFATKAEARLAFEEAVRKLEQMGKGKGGRLPFDAILKGYLEDRALRVCESTLIKDTELAKAHLGAFDGLPVAKAFAQSAMEIWYRSIAKSKGIGLERKNRIIGTMRAIVNYAYNHKNITPAQKQDCDCVLINLPEIAAQKKERTVWSAEQLQAFLSVYKDDMDKYLMFRLFAFLGARIGEFLGLQVKSYNPAERALSISQQAVYVPGSGKHMKVTDRLKTNQSYRKNKIPDALAVDLEAYIARNGLRSDDFLFHDRVSKLLPMPRTTFQRLINKGAEKAGLPHIGSHSFRHMCAMSLVSHCSVNGDFVAVSRWLGDSPSMVMNTYANHANENAQNNLINALIR